MRYKQLIILAAAISLHSLIKAQNISIQCIYLEDYSSKLDNPAKKKYDEWCLDIQNNHSAFYSTRERAYQHLKDSMIAKGYGFHDIVEASQKIMKSIQTLSIYKNIPKNNEWTITDKILTKRFKYVEKIQHPTWKLSQHTKKILGHNCQQASTEFLGRKWIVWFTPDIPIQEGPWKLWGLPGLILDARDTNEYFHFYCIEIKNTTVHPIKIEPYKYLKITRTKLLKEIWEFDANTGYYYKTRLGKKWLCYTPDGTPMKAYNAHPICLERVTFK